MMKNENSGLRRRLIPVCLALVVLAAGWFTMRMFRNREIRPLPEPTPAERKLETRLREHVTKLASEIGARHVYLPAALEKTARYIERTFREAGLEPLRETFEADEAPVSNIVVTIEGATVPDEIVVVGAHYDSVPGCPAANDNGSGVAALLEIARHFRERRPGCTLRLIAFVNEEPPWFQTLEMGSLVHARAAKKRGDNIVAMISLETIGYFTDDRKTQEYPAPLSMFYPDTGNFIGFVGNLGSRALVSSCAESFRSHTTFPAEVATLPGWMPGVGWSDHWAFWQVGYRAVMVTDTAPFRYPHYHESTDTPDKLVYDRMALVVSALASLVEDLVRRE